MLFVQHNLLAQNANRQLKASTDKNAKTTEKLSSGYKINRAADDAAGLSISEKMRRQVRGLHQTVDNISEGVGYVQTAEGALNEVQDMLQRINELAVKAANGTNTVEDRAAIDREVQQLKNEMNRIFSTTTFNERKIWEPGDRKLLGYDKAQAAWFPNTYSYIKGTVTNKNCGVIARSGYTIHAGVDDGVWITWKGWDGEDYSTEKISWQDLKDANYSFEMSKYFGVEDPKTNNLYTTDANGKIVPQFMHTVSFSVHELATIEDIVACIDTTVMTSSSSVSINSQFENADGTSKNNLKGVSVSAHINYSAAYASYLHDNVGGQNFDDGDKQFFEPNLIANGNKSNLTRYPSATKTPAAQNSTEGWEFSFQMKGIGVGGGTGIVKGTLNSISYSRSYSSSKEYYQEDDFNIWWTWINQGTPYEDKSTVGYSTATNLQGVMSALTGTKEEKRNGIDSTPGLLTNGTGATPYGGTISMYFSLTSEQAYTYGKDNQSSKDVGGFWISITVDQNDKTEQDVLDKITAALNANTILDFDKNSATSDYHRIWNADEISHEIDVPIYGGICGFYVQAGTEGGQHIEVKYEALSTIALGMQHTNVRTAESAQRAINEVKGALQMVSEQRSTFGAYQNRIEHAQNINANVEENTQAAESLIRDTDIVDTMMEYSINNILMQAGTSMLTQANQSSQSILELLQ